MEDTGSTSCVTRTCEKKTCEVGFVLETVHGDSDTCCPLQECVLASAQCPELIEPTCGEFQAVKTVLGSDNCPRYVCGNDISYFCVFMFNFVECTSTCPAVESTAEPLLDGEEYEVDNSGCCASLRKVCKKEKCPVEEECSENLIKVLDLGTKDLCCPKYKCGKCLFYLNSFFTMVFKIFLEISVCIP